MQTPTTTILDATSSFDEQEVLHELRRFLPAHLPLTDFVYQNPLSGFQNLHFHDGLRHASEILGYQVSLAPEAYRALYNARKVAPERLEKVLLEQNGGDDTSEWRERVLFKKYTGKSYPRIGALRATWKKTCRIDLDSLVHPTLFRILSGYLDQGVAIWKFPVHENGFLASIREMEKNSFASIFKTSRARNLLVYTQCDIPYLLDLLVGNEQLFKQYLFDQQFAHPGWSGLVSTLEAQLAVLLGGAAISLHDLIAFELLLEIDALDKHYGENWAPLAERISEPPVDLFARVPVTELSRVTTVWQEAFEWSYYDQVLASIQTRQPDEKSPDTKSFQAICCSDSPESTFRSSLEQFDAECETFSTPGFFGVEFFYQKAHSKLYAKCAPAGTSPKHLIKENAPEQNIVGQIYPTGQSHSFLPKQENSFYNGLKLITGKIRRIFKWTKPESRTHESRHLSGLTVENKSLTDRESGLQVGFTVQEMAGQVETLLRSIGLTGAFAPVIYVTGHTSGAQELYQAAHNCAFCSGNTGALNARVLSAMANHAGVRAILHIRGIIIPPATQFIAALHDTASDVLTFYDLDALSPRNREAHSSNAETFEKALDPAAKHQFHKPGIRNAGYLSSEPSITQQIIANHAGNTVCVIGRAFLTQNNGFKWPAYLSSYDSTTDPGSISLLNILKVLVPVCAGTNLTYFFSKLDNKQLGAGNRPEWHAMGLLGVANRSNGDLRHGLPAQMVEDHEPIRLLFIIEQEPQLVLSTIKKLGEHYEWFYNEWVHLVALNPVDQQFYVFREGNFQPYKSYSQIFPG
ncbi:putative inorganic carbon transporter subunit DabA [Dyadobacter sp. Leaf189]|uniref:putative inorganic carbon transporter subunit DabA n=1 Tax=Dyadobacter sp. Leaf189 TaxID=1736295 RepID=UPI000701AE8E|nr:putative inorganic carbon transporter subunit DabA [Dyadobacter sp. Leaf189]KQS33780.1 hypothetical protein ASG33_06935 [Dyadobacter sp. Leaf189]